MTDKATDVTVTQADRDAADEHYPPHLWKKAARDDLAIAFARHRISHSLPGDALRGALERLSKLTPFSANAATAADFAATVHAIADTALAALTPSALSGGDYAEAFDILVDVQSALVLTAEHSNGLSVASFVSSSRQYERLNRFLHERQHSDPRSPSALSSDAGEGERLEHARAALQRVRDRFTNIGNSSPLWSDMAEDMDAYAAEGLDRSKARG
jgi:hypothetical protein